MFDQMKKLMELKKQAELLKRELDAVSVEINEARGIKLVINGSQSFQSFEISEELLKPENKARLQSDILRSLNAAIKKSQAVAAQKMQSMPGLNIPGLS